MKTNLQIQTKVNHFVCLMALMLFSAMGWGQTTETFSTPGNYTFTVPTGVSEITVEVWGAGGGGNYFGSNRSGGGGGGFASSVLTVASGQQFNFNVGLGGIPGTSGGTSSFGNNLVSASGGQPGIITFIGGAGGVGINGQILYNGGNGANAPGGGGSSAGIGANGTNASGLNGGTAPAGGGNGGSIPSGNNQSGGDGFLPGGGGAGKSGPGNGGNSGSGAQGQVRITYTDSCSNDNESPAVTCVGNQTEDTDAGVCTYTHSGTAWDATATDNCSVASIEYVLSGATSGSGTSLDGVVFNLGTTTVTWTATDGSGNIDVCSFDVTIEDNENPAVTCVGNQTEDTDAGVCTYTHSGTAWDATATDNCSVASIEYVLSGATSGSGTSLDGVVFNLGTTTVTWTATDGSGNLDVCSFDVTIADNENPAVTCVGNQTEDTDAGVCTYTHSGTAWDATATDNCSVASIEYVLSGATSGSGTSLDGVVFNLGTTTVTWTATDGSNNVDVCSFDVTIEDNESPIVVTKNITIQLDANGEASIVPGDIDNGSSDNCSIASMSLDIYSFDCDDVNNPVTVTLTVTDPSGNFDTATAIVTVLDEVDPDIDCVNDEDVLADPYQTYYTVQGTEFDATADDACGIASLTYVLSGATTDSGSFSLDGVQLNIGATTITWTAVDVNGNDSVCSTVITVEQRPTTLTYTGDLEEQYSDQVDLSAVLTDDDSGDGVVGMTITFTIGNQETTAVTDGNGVAETTMILDQDPAGTYTVLAEFDGDATYIASEDEPVFYIRQENAMINYVGQLLIAESSSNGTPFNFFALIQDSEVWDNDDLWEGDIRNAKIQYSLYEMDGSNISHRYTSPVLDVIDLLTTGDFRTAVVSHTDYIMPSLTNSEPSRSYGIEITILNYYTGFTAKEDLMATLYKPVGDFITGGGYILPQNPSPAVGLYPSDPGTRTNFGFNVKFNANGRNLKGRLNFIWRTDNGRIFQARSNAIQSLGVDIADEENKIAVFEAKCNVRDLSESSLPIPNSGNVTMYVTMVDRGEPGDQDVIGFTLWNGNQLWYSSNWSGLGTDELNLSGGNLIVHSGFNSGTTNQSTSQTQESNFLEVDSWPNPSNVQFSILVSSTNTTEPIHYTVFDIAGRFIEESTGNVGETYKIGDRYPSGVYVVKVSQGGAAKFIKLVKK